MTWLAPTASGHLNATVRLPGSKSLTARYLVLAALAAGPMRIAGALRSRDTDLMAKALTQLGAQVTYDQTGTCVTGHKHSECRHRSAHPGSGFIDCGLAGTVMRFVPPLAALTCGNTTFDGDERARLRPMRPMLEALRACGVMVKGDALPFTIIGTGAVPGGEIQLDAGASSQFVSGLLLTAPCFTTGLTLHHVGSPLPSRPHIDMTVAVLREFGIVVQEIAANSWRVEPGIVPAHDVVVEPDLSNAAPFLAAALIAGGTVGIPAWPAASTQPGIFLPQILTALGATTSYHDGLMTITSDGAIKGVDLDLSAAGELAPTIAALAALADSPSRITGIGHLRGHETDRLAALTANINGLGGAVRTTPDGLEITPSPLHAGTWESYADHRIATAGALIGLRVRQVVVSDIATVGKTLPTFTSLWQDMLRSGT